MTAHSYKWTVFLTCIAIGISRFMYLPSTFRTVFYIILYGVAIFSFVMYIVKKRQEKKEQEESDS